MTKDRHGALSRPRAATLELTSDAESGRITWEIRHGQQDTGDSTSWRPTILMDRVEGYLRQQTEPVSRKAIADAVTGKREFVLQAIDFLLLDGKANERPGRRGAKLVALADVFPVPDVFQEPLGTPEGNDVFPVPPLYKGNTSREQVAGTGRAAEATT